MGFVSMIQSLKEIFSCDEEDQSEAEGRGTQVNLLAWQEMWLHFQGCQFLGVRVNDLVIGREVELFIGEDRVDAERKGTPTDTVCFLLLLPITLIYSNVSYVFGSFFTTCVMLPRRNY